MLSACGGDDRSSASLDGSPVDGAPQPDAGPTFDAMPLPDAQPAAVDCVGEPLPTEAADPVEVSGNVFTISGFSEAPVEGATLQAFEWGADVNVATPLATDTTDADGNYSLSATTGGEPLDAFVYATAEGYVPTREYPGQPVSADLVGAPIPLLTEDLLASLHVFAGNIVQEPDKATMFMVVADCDGNPVEGATVSTDPAAGDIVYADANGFPNSSRVATSTAGIAFLFNVPTGSVEVDAEVGGVSLREHTVECLSDEVTATLVGP